MTRTPASRAACLTALAALTAILGGCGGSGKPSPRADPPPTSVRDANPCSFLPKSAMTRYGLKQAHRYHSESARSCEWSSASFSMLILARWDTGSLVDFSQAFPMLVQEDVRLDGMKVVVGKSDVRPACAALFFTETGTIAEVVVGDTPPSTADAACERVKALGSAAVRTMRGQHLLDAAPTPATTPP